jgi:hypothetical protein
MENYTSPETDTLILWINNDEGLYRYWTDRAAELSEEDLTEALKAYFKDEANPLTGTASVYSDLLNNALGAINYREVATNLKEE